MEDYRIQAHQISVSSSYQCHGTECNGNSARLNLISNSTIKGGWFAGVADQHQWIKVDLGGWRLIAGVVTQGRGSRGIDQWITKYKIQHSADGSSWVDVTNIDGQDVRWRSVVVLN